MATSTLRDKMTLAHYVGLVLILVLFAQAGIRAYLVYREEKNFEERR